MKNWQLIQTISCCWLFQVLGSKIFRVIQYHGQVEHIKTCHVCSKTTMEPQQLRAHFQPLLLQSRLQRDLVPRIRTFAVNSETVCMLIQTVQSTISATVEVIKQFSLVQLDLSSIRTTHTVTIRIMFLDAAELLKRVLNPLSQVHNQLSPLQVPQPAHLEALRILTFVRIKLMECIPILIVVSTITAGTRA